MDYFFDLTYNFLKYLERVTGLSYEEINVIIWFIGIPFSWSILIDKIYQKNYFKIGFTILILAIVSLFDFENFSKILFNTSVDFLIFFNVFGSTYKTTSVIICLCIPFLIYVFLIRKVYFNKAS